MSKVKLSPEESLEREQYRHEMKMLDAHLTRLKAGPGAEKKRESLTAIRDLASAALARLDGESPTNVGDMRS